MRKVFSFEGRPSAYWDRDICRRLRIRVGKLGAGHAAFRRRASAQYPAAIPLCSGERAGRPRGPDRFGGAKNWTVSEMRVLAGGGELPRTPEWRLSAWPNGWDVQLAFDNNYATRWSTWQAMPPRAYVAIDFGRARKNRRSGSGVRSGARRPAAR